MSETTVTAFHDIASLEKAVGGPAYLSAWVTVTQQMIDQFAAVTIDPQWIHIDADRAKKESPYGTTIAHGFLTLSLLSHFIETAISFPTARMGVNYGFDRVRFVSAVPSGAELQAAFTLSEVKATDQGVALAWAVEVRARGASKPTLAAMWLSRIMM